MRGDLIAWALVIGVFGSIVWHDSRPHVVEERSANNAKHFVNHLETEMRYLRDTTTGDCFAFLPTKGTGGPALAHIPCRDRTNMIEFSS